MDYQLTQTGEQTQNLLDKVPTIETNLNAEILRSTNKDEELETAIGNEKTRAEGAEGALETAIGNEKTRAEGAELALAGDIEDNTTAIGAEKTRAEGAEDTLQGNIDAEATTRENADDALQGGIDAINGKIPNAASQSNQLADKAFVNSSIATNTADFKGTYNSLEQLEQVSANANDYGFVVATDAAGNTVYNRYKYVAGTGWMFEYALNNSSFTSEQWAAIQSGITALLVAKLADLPTVAQLTTQLNQIIASVTAEKTRAENAEAALAGDIADLDTAIDNEKTRAEGAESVLRGDIAGNTLAIATEKTRAEGAEGTLQTAVNNEKARAEGAELTLQQNINAEATLRDNADDTLQANIDAINAKIPSAASSSNQLADKAFVNSSISTNTAEFKGTYNSLAELQAVTGANANDYGFVIATDAAGNTVYNRYKYVEGTGWVFEYALNNSSFTSEQWAAIQSGITALLVSKLSGLPDIDGLNAMFAAITALIPSAATSSNKLVDYAQMVAALATKQNTLTFDNAPTENSQNPVTSGGLYTCLMSITAAIAGLQSSKQNVLTFDESPTAGSDNPVKSKGILSAINTATAPLATQSDLNAATARISTTEADISALKDLYNSLLQSAPQIIQPSDTWPVANPSTTVIYRVIDRVNTPPEYYSDYMWNGTAFVLMATYNNAIDDEPTAVSENLVMSSGIYRKIERLSVGILLSPDIIEDHAYSPSDGIMHNFTTLDCTPKIEVPYGSSFCYLKNAEYYSCACFDKNDNFIGDLSNYTKLKNNQIIELLSGTRYFSLSFLKEKNIDYSKISILCNEKDISSLLLNFNFSPYIWNNKAYDNTGTLHLFSLLDCTSLIKLPENYKGCNLYCNAPFYTIACFDGQMNFIKNIQSNENKFLPDGTTYLSISFLRSDNINYSFLNLGIINTNQGVQITDNKTKKKYYLLGDSITYWDSRISWYDESVYMVAYPSYIRNILKADTVNKGNPGDPASSITNRLLNTDISDAYAVTYMAGTNDVALQTPIGELGTLDTSTYIGALEVAIRYVMQNYPDVKFYFLSPLFYHGKNITPYAEAMQTVAHKYGVPILRWDLVSGLNELNYANFYVDDVHPSNKGHKRLADSLIAFLQNY